MAPAVAADISYLERMVVRPTWKEILLDLIAQNKIDPWNVDLIKLADEFMLRIKEMHSLDLGLQANIALVSRIPPKRQITMDELIAEMERVIKYESAEIKRLPKGAITETVDLVLAGEDIEKIKEQVLLRIRENVDETGFATFSSILREKTRWEVVYSLLSVLHLAKEGLVSIHQDKLFGDILISIIENNGEKERKEDEKIKIKAESIG